MISSLRADFLVAVPSVTQREILCFFAFMDPKTNGLPAVDGRNPASHLQNPESIGNM